MYAILLFLPLLTAVSASPQPNLKGIQAKFSSWTKQVCATDYAMKSVVPSSTTQTRTYTIPWIQTTTVTPSTTVTAPVSTTIVTTTVVDTSSSTLSQVIDTTTSTSTSTETDTSTTTITSTEIDTATSTFTATSATTTTFSTVAGFTPVASVPSVQQSGGGSRQKRNLAARNVVKQRNEPLEERAAAKTSITSAKPSPSLLSECDKLPRYPSVIKCQKVVVTASISYKTVTAKSTTTYTVGNPSTSTSTSTVSISTTTTITPAATTVTSSTTTTSTTVVSATATSAEISTTTISTTSTSFLPLQTAYAACGADNLINRVGSTQISDASRFQGTTFQRTTDQSPDACCVACQVTAGCAGFVFRQATGNAVVACDLAVVTTCNPAVAAFRFQYRSTASFIGTVGDGPCGQGSWGGSL